MGRDYVVLSVDADGTGLLSPLEDPYSPPPPMCSSCQLLICESVLKFRQVCGAFL